MWEHDKLPSGINDDRQFSGINEDNENEDLDNEDLDENEDNDNEDDDDWDESQNQNQNQKPTTQADWRKKFYFTTNVQNRKIDQLTKELNQIKDQKTLSDDDLQKIKDKYDEDDLEVIEKIIERKTNQVLENKKTTSLAQKELNIFLKDYPDISEPELRHVTDLQKQYWYSLKKAYSVLFGRNSEQEQRPQKHSMWNNFWWNRSSNQNNNKNDSDEAAMKDMEKYM